MSSFFEDMKERAKELNLDVILSFVFSNQDVKDFVVNLNTNEQLFEGIDGTGTSLQSIGGRYSDATIAYKRTEGQPFNRVTLKDTGSFYDSFTIGYENGGKVVISADTIKEDTDLRERWGDNLLGLTDESIDSLFFFIAPLIEEFILDYITQDF